MTRTFLHVDMDAFFASVEQHDHPELRGKPVVVGGARDQRGVVAAASYEARRYGIHSAMPTREAARRCPDAVFVPVNMPRYQEISHQIVVIFERYSPLVEPVSVDEAFIDITGAERLFGTGEETGRLIKKAVRDETGLTASIGVAPNKFLAKLASDMDKPDGLTVVPAGREAIARFLAPLPVSRMWGVGKVTADSLRKLGVTTIGDLQRITDEQLASVVGRHNAGHLKSLSWGEDSREIELDREEKSISRETTFDIDCEDAERLERVLCDLVDDVGSRLRAAGRRAEVAHLKLRWQGFQTITRQRSLPRPTCDDFSLRDVALSLFRREELHKPVRLIGFGVSGFSDRRAEQLDLFGTDGGGRHREESLSHAVDDLRERFGTKAIGRAKQDQGA